MLYDADLGNIDFVVNSRARRISVRILYDGLRVSLPPFSTPGDGMAFVNTVRKKLKARKESLKYESEQIRISPGKLLKTLSFDIEAQYSSRRAIFFLKQPDRLLIELPHGMDCSEAPVQAKLWEGCAYFLRKEAQKLLPGRVKKLAEEQGFSFSSLRIQSSKTRWGSCSARKSINLSFFLLLLPPHLIDYVILHELCHTKVMNHGPEFWIWMDRVTGNRAKELNGELKRYRIP